MDNRNNNGLNKEKTLYGGLAVIVVGILMTGLSIISGGLGDKISNFKWRGKKQGEEINH